jgi:hypothetical protein
MRSNQGWELFNTWTYRSIEQMDRIEFDQGFADKEGHRVAQAQLGLPPDIPQNVPHVVSNTTELTVHEWDGWLRGDRS